MKPGRTVRWVALLAVAACTVGSARAGDAGTKVAATSKPGRKWRTYTTRTLADLKGFAPAAKVALGKYGGLASVTLRATGFFRTEKVRGRWMLVDPDGHPFISMGLNSVNPETRYNKANFAKAFTGQAQWAEKTGAMMRRTGLNTLGCWSQWQTFRKLERPWVYTQQWNFMSAYGSKRGRTHWRPGNTGYAGGVIYVFDPEFETFCDGHAKQLAATKDDPYLLGHFSDNEMPLRREMLDLYLKMPPGDPGRAAAVKWLKARGRTMSKFGDADREAFLEVVVARYFRIVGRAIKKHDPNHLYLGARLHGGAKYLQAVHKGAGPYVDVVSVNYYSRWTPERERMDQWAAWSGKPFLVTEWYVKGVDSGMKNASGAGWLVKTQADRGRFYQHFALGLLGHPGCVGWHWHRYADNAAGRAGGTSNKGLVGLTYRPYGPLRDAMAQLNGQVYTLTAIGSR